MSASSSPTIILTGASRGLGLAVLRILLSKYPANIVTLSRTISSELQQLKEQYSQRVVTVTGDVGISEDNSKAVTAAVDHFGGIDGVIINAGSIEPIAKLSDVNLSLVPAYIQQNLIATLYLLQPALPHLRKNKGKIVLVSSGASESGYQGWGLYSMVKAGMNSFARTLANEESDYGVGVWSIRPGMVDSSMQELLRNVGPGKMKPEEMVKFQNAFDQGKLLPAERPGAVIAGLSINGPIELSGQYLNWEDEKLSSFR